MDLTETYDFKDPERKWFAFFGAIYHKDFNYVVKTLQEYDIGQYVVAKEISTDSHQETNGEHIHFVVEMTARIYHTYSKRVFKDKYKLRGQARDGKARQYGKVTEIKDITRMIAYCLKDNDYETNIPHDEIEEYKKVSFKKIETKQTNNETFTQKITADLEKKYPERNWSYDEDADEIIETILDRLGYLGKVFDEHQVKKMFYGVYNQLKKTGRQQSEFRKKIKLAVLGY